MGKTLLDIVLGNARAEDLPLEELTKGLEQNVLSYTAIQALWSRSSVSGQLVVLELLKAQKRGDIPSSLIKTFLESAGLMKRIAVKYSTWFLSQKTLTPQVASQILKKGIYKSNGIPFERFVQASVCIKKTMNHWKDDLAWLQSTLTGAQDPWLTPFVAAGAPVKYCGDALLVGVPFREDAGDLLKASGVSAKSFASKINFLAARFGRSVAYSHTLTSRSIDTKNAICSIVLGHPHLSDDFKVEMLRLADQKIISLDNLIQLKVIPKELLFGDLRTLCEQSKHYVSQFRALQTKGGE